ncbi:MAG: N-acetyltransferase [Cryobacterium sp.]|uniref:GNAT family N-acetyltransferase n=1 Tax=unclassified Cryobacterium TaxID=2649013 RepID=UPI001A271989|nr:MULTISPECIES: GNAT family N-acetyltransferase [unclassified Cryobacterium]MCY7403800.1 N-acetyltransferase [Cryobacterium sp.]
MTAESTTIHSQNLAELGLLMVRREPEQSRYTVWLGGETVGLADYVTTSNAVHFTHTEIDPAQRQLGVASILIEQALDDVRARTDLAVVPACSYVAHWIDTHAEYQDLLTRGR